jgi:hypothetical protein
MATALKVVPALSDLAADINENHDLALMHVGQSFDHAVKAGLLLMDAKKQVPHGKWLAWLKANVKVGARQAANYMRVAACPDEKRSAVANLSLRKAIHELALHDVRERDAKPTLQIVDNATGKRTPMPEDEAAEFFDAEFKTDCGIVLPIGKNAGKTVDELNEVEDAAVVLANVLDSIADAKAVAEAYRKIFKLSSFDDEAKAQIRKAIKLLIVKWRTADSALD